MIDYQKIPPQDLELEEVVLGALLLNAPIEDVPFLRPEVFYSTHHSHVFQAISELSNENIARDIMTVTQRMRTNKHLTSSFGPVEISQLTNRIASTQNLPEHAAILYEKYMRRSAISIAGDIIKSAYDESEDIFATQTRAATELDNLVDFKGMSFPDGLHDLHKSLEDRNPKLLEQKGLSGITTGLSDLDMVTGGWQKTDLIILAARPGMGKTSLALKFAVEACKSGENVLFYSLEMSREQLFWRMASMETGIPLEKFYRRGLNNLEIDQERTWFHENANKWHITIDDTAGLPIQDMRMKSRQIARKRSVGLIITDYLQLHTVKDFKNGNRDNEIGRISSGLKNIAKELSCPVIALSQLSRKVEDRGGDKRPMLSDLRDSGNIEQDADMVMFIYRPEYYGLTDMEGVSTHGKAELNIPKYRNGKTGSVVVGWDAAHTRFHNDTMAENRPKLNPDQMF